MKIAEVEKKIIFVGKLIMELTIFPLSMSSIFNLLFIAEMAHPIPAGPAPMITRSYFIKTFLPLVSYVI